MNSQMAQEKPFLNIPDAISEEAKTFLRTLKDPSLNPPFPDEDNIEGWKKLQAGADANATKMSEPILKRFEHTVRDRDLGGVPALELCPKDYQENGSVIV